MRNIFLFTILVSCFSALGQSQDIWGNFNVYGISTANQCGIGTTTPNNLLEVGSGALGTIPGTKGAISSTSGNSGWDVGQGASNRGHVTWIYNATAASAYMTVGTHSGSNILDLQDEGGNVGIGTSGPSYLLDVNGTLHAAGNATLSGTGNSVGTITSGTWAGTTVAVAYGGTGQTSYTDGQLLIGDSSTSGLDKASLTAGSGITITSGHGSITIAGTGVSPAYTYSAITSDPAPAVVGTIYSTSGGSFTITLPDATSAGNVGKNVQIFFNGTTLTDKITINTTSSQHLHGASGQINSGGFVLNTTGEMLEVISNGTDWNIVRHITKTPWVNAGVNLITSTSAYTFTIPSSSINAGTIYTNNGHTFYVSTTTSSSTTLTASGTGSPGASGTLTFVSGSPSGNLSFSASTTTGAPVKGNTTTTDETWWMRDGQNMFVRTGYRQTSTTSAVAAAGSVLWFIPGGQLADSNYMTFMTAAVLASTPSQSNNNVGTVYCFNQTPTAADGPVVVYDSNKVLFSLGTVGNGEYFGGGSSYNFTAANTACSSEYRIPIVGWQP